MEIKRTARVKDIAGTRPRDLDRKISVPDVDQREERAVQRSPNGRFDLCAFGCGADQEPFVRTLNDAMAQPHLTDRGTVRYM